MVETDLTTSQFAARLDPPVGQSTVRLWCTQGLIPGAREENTPRGKVWLIPASALEGFKRPKRGAPQKPKREDRAA
jgi:hypothetical protein